LLRGSRRNDRRDIGRAELSTRVPQRCWIADAQVVLGRIDQRRKVAAASDWVTIEQLRGHHPNRAAPHRRAALHGAVDQRVELTARVPFVPRREGYRDTGRPLRQLLHAHLGHDLHLLGEGKEQLEVWIIGDR
jgi:hypothetical protein